MGGTPVGLSWLLGRQTRAVPLSFYACARERFGADGAPNLRTRAHMTHPRTNAHTRSPTCWQLANISAQTDTMISGLKQSVSKDGGQLGTPTLLVLDHTRTTCFSVVPLRNSLPHGCAPRVSTLLLAVRLTHRAREHGVE